MKRFFSVLLALVLALACVGCGNNQEEPSGVYYDITGIGPDETVVTVGDVDIPAQLYFYWMAYTFSSLETQILSANAYYGIYGELIGEDGYSLVWDAPLSDEQTVGQFAVAQAEDTVLYFAALESMAEELGAGMTEEDLATLAEDRAAAIEELGGEEAFQEYLYALGITEYAFDRIASSSYLYDNLADLVLQEGSALYLAPEDYNQYASYADHILFLTIDATTGESLTEEEIAAKRATAEDLLAQLQAADDPSSLFPDLADQYSEDPGRYDNPTGYIYTPGTMVTVFEDAVDALEPGEISDIVESDYGFHIILRKDLLQGLEDYPDQKRALAEEHLQSLLDLEMTQMTAVHSDKLNDFSAENFYTEYSAYLQQLGQEEESAQSGEDSGTDGSTDNSGTDNSSTDNSSADNSSTDNSSTDSNGTANNSTVNDSTDSSGQ